MAISVEDARELLRREVAASSLNAVAARVGIDRSTLRTFVKPGGVAKPIGRVLEPILAYAESRLESAKTGEDTAEAPSGEAAAEMRGRLATTVEWLHSLSGQVDALASGIRGVEDSLKALRSSLDRATGGVAHVVDSGALGALTKPLITPDQVREKVAAMKAELERAAPKSA